MSASAIYAVFALLFYTAFNAIFARTLHHVTPAVALPIYTSVVVVLGAAVFFLTRSEATVLPDFAEVRLLIFCGVILLAADFCFVSAYNRNGSMALIATILSLLPVTTAVANLVLSGKLPNTNQLIAFAMAIGAVIIIVRNE